MREISGIGIGITPVMWTDGEMRLGQDGWQPPVQVLFSEEER